MTALPPPETHTAGGLRRCPLPCGSPQLKGRQCGNAVERGKKICTWHRKQLEALAAKRAVRRRPK